MRTGWALLSLLLTAQGPSRPAVDLASLLRDLGDPGSLARLPSPSYESHQSSSEHRPAQGGVLLDVTGPGAIVRVFSGDPSDRLRIHIDGAEQAVIEGLRLDALGDHGENADPLTQAAEGTASLYLPIPFSKSCKVLHEGSENSLCRIDYRLYESGTEVTSLLREDLARARTGATRLGREWESTRGRPTFSVSVSEDNPTGGLVCVDPELAKGPRAVCLIHLRVESADLDMALRSAVLRLVFDGEETAACPLGSFFGVGGPATLRTWPLRVSPGIDERSGRTGEQIELACRWSMPYRDRFDMRIDGGPKDLHVAGLVHTEAWSWDERSLHFHADHRVLPPTPADGHDQPIRFSLARRGVLAGEVLWVSSSDSPFDEGSVELWTDERHVSSSGWMDAYGISQGRAQGSEQPFQLQVTSGGALSLGRFRIPDPVPFRTSLRFELQPVHRRKPMVKAERGAQSAAEGACSIIYYARPADRGGAPIGK